MNDGRIWTRTEWREGRLASLSNFRQAAALTPSVHHQSVRGRLCDPGLGPAPNQFAGLTPCLPYHTRLRSVRTYCTDRRRLIGRLRRSKQGIIDSPSTVASARHSNSDPAGAGGRPLVGNGDAAPTLLGNNRSIGGHNRLHLVHY